MVYTMDEGQLLRVWTVISCFGRMREITDPLIQSEITKRSDTLNGLRPRIATIAWGSNQLGNVETRRRPNH
jgi:hypothetical protein